MRWFQYLKQKKSNRIRQKVGLNKLVDKLNIFWNILLWIKRNWVKLILIDKEYTFTLSSNLDQDSMFMLQNINLMYLSITLFFQQWFEHATSNNWYQFTFLTEPFTILLYLIQAKKWDLAIPSILVYSLPCTKDCFSLFYNQPIKSIYCTRSFFSRFNKAFLDKMIWCCLAIFRPRPLAGDNGWAEAGVSWLSRDWDLVTVDKTIVIPSQAGHRGSLLLFIPTLST